MTPFSPNLSLMGVMNITPDSFSDGGEVLPQNFLEKAKTLVKDGVTVLDIGAESTAPMNEPISKEEEQERLKTFFFPQIKGLKDLGVNLSIDTYRRETFLFVLDELEREGFKEKVLWNDVSSKYEEVIPLMKERNFDYCLCHSLVDTRENSSHHMKFLTKEDILKNISAFFKKAYEKFEAEGLMERVLFDPCFGFSKTTAQNLEILKGLGGLLREFKSVHWLIGTSRKKFIREHLETTDRELLDEFQANLLEQMRLEFLDQKLMVRLHDPQKYSLIKERNEFKKVWAFN